MDKRKKLYINSIRCCRQIAKCDEIHDFVIFFAVSTAYDFIFGG